MMINEKQKDGPTQERNDCIPRWDNLKKFFLICVEIHYSFCPTKKQWFFIFYILILFIQLQSLTFIYSQTYLTNMQNININIIIILFNI